MRERIPELAVLKSLGFTDRTVLGLVLAESLAAVRDRRAGRHGRWLPIIPPLVLPPEYPIRANADAWIFVGIAVVVLAIAVGLPPALRAMRLQIVDALAGR